MFDFKIWPIFSNEKSDKAKIENFAFCLSFIVNSLMSMRALEGAEMKLILFEEREKKPSDKSVLMTKGLMLIWSGIVLLSSEVWC